MKKQVFINLAVENLEKSMEFYSALEFTYEPLFSDVEGKCMSWSEHIYVMLLTHEKFSSFTQKPLADTKSNIASLLSLSVESIDMLNNIMEKALEVGGIEPTPMMDYGFMQQRTIEDYDGHTWEIFYMDMSKIPAE